MKIRDYIALPFLLLSFLFEYLGIFIGGDATAEWWGESLKRKMYE